MPKTRPRTGFAILLAAATLGACVSSSGEPPPLAPLAENQREPVLALFEHVLPGYFAAFGANPPTTCAKLVPNPLSAEQEEALIARFVRLAPASRCLEQPGQSTRDAFTGEPAALVQVYSFECSTAAQCRAWVTAPGTLAKRYVMQFADGKWSFTSDPRLLAQ